MTISYSYTVDKMSKISSTSHISHISEVISSNSRPDTRLNRVIQLNIKSFWSKHYEITQYLANSVNINADKCDIFIRDLKELFEEIRTRGTCKTEIRVAFDRN